MITRDCAENGTPIEGMAYILRTTEGERIVSPEALFHHRADAGTLELLQELTERVRALEEHVVEDQDVKLPAEDAPTLQLREPGLTEDDEGQDVTPVAAAPSPASLPKRKPRTT